jgi:hypothetical protein
MRASPFSTEANIMTLEMSSRELEAAIDRLDAQVLELRDRIDAVHGELCEATTEYWRDIKLLKAAVRQLQAALGLPQLAEGDEEDDPSITTTLAERLIAERNQD